MASARKVPLKANSALCSAQSPAIVPPSGEVVDASASRMAMTPVKVTFCRSTPANPTSDHAVPSARSERHRADTAPAANTVERAQAIGDSADARPTIGRSAAKNSATSAVAAPVIGRPAGTSRALLETITRAKPSPARPAIRVNGQGTRRRSALRDI
jgi:hypothetical protein